MTSFTNRPYASDADLEAMIALVKTRPAERLTDYPSIIDLHEMYLEAEIQANTQLWEDVYGNLLGFVIMEADYRAFRLEVSPGAVSNELGPQMISWATQYAQKAGWEALQTGSAADNAIRIALLEEQGFVRQAEYTLRFERSLAEPIPAPLAPAGFTLRHIEGEHEVEALVALHRAAFGTQYLTVERRLSWMRRPAYDPALDLVAVTSNGTLAAYVLCSISEEENALTGQHVGYTDPVATHPKFQRKGLARALLLTGLHLLKQRGMKTARLGTGNWNEAMQKTAESVGYRAVSTPLFFEKSVEI